MRKTFFQKRASIKWTHFTRHGDAIFLSLGREIRIGVLTVATLSAACPQSSAAHMSMGADTQTYVNEAADDAAEDKAEALCLDINSLQHGDLLFCVASQSVDGFSTAIASVTQGIKRQPITHVAIVNRNPDGRLTVLEATSRHGVWQTPVDSFLASSNHTPDGHPMVMLGRLKDTSVVAAAVERAKTYLGRPYDFLFLPNDSALYCSELVHYSFLDHQGRYLFPQQPMSFHDHTGRVTDFWLDYYRQRGMTVPEGDDGTNPGAISRSDKLRIVGTFFPIKTSNNTVAYEVQLRGAEVTATRAPLSPDRAVRLVQTLNRKDIEASGANSVNDLLKLAAGVDVRQRGGFGIQTDIGINGGNEDQLTVLLNGINISNPHTGHLTADLPVEVDDIERIEVIEGGAGRVYGSQAFSGAINIITRTDHKSGIDIHARGGSYGTWGGNANISLTGQRFNNRLSGSYSQSDGTGHSDDFRKSNAFWRGQYTSSTLEASVQTGMSTMQYGANTFYGTGSDSQYEEDSRYMVGVQARSKGRITVPVQAYWTRSLDHYVWWRDNPSAYQNFHQTNVYGACANAYTTWALGTTALGAEWRQEDILSTRLGRELSLQQQALHTVPHHSDQHYKYHDSRTNLGLYLEHDLALGPVSLSLGALLSHSSTDPSDARLYPGIDASWRVAPSLRLFASFNQSQRNPTFTDLYYNGPGLTGNSRLLPERSTDWAVGLSYADTYIHANLRGFHRRGTNMIDWVRPVGATVYTTANSDIASTGFEALASVDIASVLGRSTVPGQLTVSYCYNHQHRLSEQQAQLYATPLTFLRHKFVATLRHRIAGPLSAQWTLTLKHREGEFDNVITGTTQRYGTFATVDATVQWERRDYQLYVAVNNLTNHTYYDIANIPQPGLWLMTGCKVKVRF